ncbi:hypothetical protein GO755_17740 [Spirosoma sp. HMF4905]|uniref:Carboxypeptidase regulatory-like domain-containing protein n=1 Tax=Spirosoma arboris TaxID=2682092 RepID=A0A7K1SE76_9BACT|nr:carboxypeptidase-like regulatory domain-containing protein [Spirosoma arboris]MVM31896.1 hypothetical protein [Spirosoma arboris]
MRSLTIQIPQACHEGWDEMQPTERGRFCGSCQKTVVDYTKFTDQELVKLLSKAPETSCGRFRNEQLNRQLPLSNPSAMSVWRHWAGLLTLSLFGWQTAKAQLNQAPKPSPPTSVRPDFTVSTIASRKIFEPDAKRVITGRVMLMDSIDHLSPASQATVTVYQLGKVWETQTDSTGTFSLSVSVQVLDKPLQSGNPKIVVATSFPNHSRGSATLDVRPATTPITVDDIILYKQSKMKNITGGGICLIKTPSLWQKLKQKLFH